METEQLGIDNNTNDSPRSPPPRYSPFAYSETAISDTADDDQTTTSTQFGRLGGHLNLARAWNDNASSELGLEAIVSRYDRMDGENTPLRKPISVRKLTRTTGINTFYAGKNYREMLTREGIKYWELDDSEEANIDEDGTKHVAPEYKWRIGAHGLPLPIFNGAAIKISRKLKKNKSAYWNHAHSTVLEHRKSHHKNHFHSNKSHFDFFFDSNGQIQKHNGDKLSYHWHIFDRDNKPVDWVEAHLDPKLVLFRYDGKIFDSRTFVEKPFKWMYVHQDGSTLDPGFEDEQPQVIYPADGTHGMRLLTNADGSIFISKFGKPVLVVDKDLHIFGPDGNKIMIFNETDEYVDPSGQPLEIGHHILDPNGKPIMLVESLEENSKRLGMEVPKALYNGFNVHRDKLGSVVYGNPINLDPNGPAVLLLKYFDVHQPKVSMARDTKPVFLDEKDYLPFWIIDPDGKLIALHDKMGRLWDRRSKPIMPTGKKEEANGDYYEYYLFTVNKKPCKDNDVCFRDTVSSTSVSILNEFNPPEPLSLEGLRDLMQYYTKMGGTSNTALFKCLPFPKCIDDGTFQEFVDDICKDPCKYPANRKQRRRCQSNTHASIASTFSNSLTISDNSQSDY